MAILVGSISRMFIMAQYTQAVVASSGFGGSTGGIGGCVGDLWSWIALAPNAMEHGVGYD